MAEKKKKPFIKLRCQNCQTINYYLPKSKKATQKGKKLELRKFCKECKKHTLHKEAKK